MKNQKSIFGAVTEARGSRPAFVEIGARTDRETGKFTADSRRWECRDTYRGDIERLKESEDGKQLRALPIGAVLDVYAYARIGGGSVELEQNFVVIKVVGGWQAEAER